MLNFIKRQQLGPRNESVTSNTIAVDFDFFAQRLALNVFNNIAKTTFSTSQVSKLVEQCKYAA
ncbi:hypothetical protein AQ853_00605 [Burkholderia pseudomallei]|nr:hypothetical protein WS91_01450 [Burkholderia sp. MSMB1498]OAB20454.1 hypothetical protein AQ853_00605 [Burkholderia pseudomallei]